MKICPYCSEEIQDNAIVCRYCGRELDPSQVKEVTSKIDKPPNVESLPKIKMSEADKRVLEKWGKWGRFETEKSISHTPLPKKQVNVQLATFLNFIPWGAIGYLYIRKFGRWAVVLSLQLFSLAPMTWLGLREYNKYLLLIIWIFSLFDVYAQAKAINEA